jgi:hypothetical protein
VSSRDAWNPAAITEAGSDAPGSLSLSLRCAIYPRMATLKKPNEVNSIAQQVGSCKRFAKGKNGSLATITASLILNSQD